MAPAEVSMIDVDLNDAKPLRTLPDNSEARLTITRAEIEESKSRAGVQNIRLWLDCGESDVDDIQAWIPIPNPGWKEEEFKTYTKAVNRFKEFCTAFHFSPPISNDRLVGLSGWGIVSEEEDDRTPGKFRNGVRGWVAK